jgi:hypothetical protein
LENGCFQITDCLTNFCEWLTGAWLLVPSRIRFSVAALVL